MNISYPGTLLDAEQTTRFLQRMVDELNLALEQAEEGVQAAVSETASTVKEEASTETSERVQSTYNDLKALIVKTADIVKDEMNTEVTERLGGYVSQSEYGTYREAVAQTISENAKRTEEVYAQVSQLDSEVGTYTRQLRGNIVHGIVNVGGEERVGIAVGENLRMLEDGTIDTNNHMAFFTSDRLSFWLNGAEMAYFSDAKLHVSSIVASDSVQIGNWVWTHSSLGLTLKWIGGE